MTKFFNLGYELLLMFKYKWSWSWQLTNRAQIASEVWNVKLTRYNERNI